MKKAKTRRQKELNDRPTEESGQTSTTTYQQSVGGKGEDEEYTDDPAEETDLVADARGQIIEHLKVVARRAEERRKAELRESQTNTATQSSQHYGGGTTLPLTVE